jgi:signal peptidase I
LLGRLAVFAVVIAALALGLRAFLVEPFFVPSASMEPTLHGCPSCNDDRVLVSRLSYKLHSVHRGDVVVFNKPPSLQLNDTNLIKRVIGLPGETVSAHGGSVYVGDRRLSEPYVNPKCVGTADFGPVTVPAGDAFMMGDNRCNSTDSRVFGPVAESKIVGRAFVIVWPLGRIHWL